MNWLILAFPIVVPVTIYWLYRRVRQHCRELDEEIPQHDSIYGGR